MPLFSDPMSHDCIHTIVLLTSSQLQELSYFISLNCNFFPLSNSRSKNKDGGWHSFGRTCSGARNNNIWLKFCTICALPLLFVANKQLNLGLSTLEGSASLQRLEIMRFVSDFILSTVSLPTWLTFRSIFLDLKCTIFLDYAVSRSLALPSISRIRDNWFLFFPCHA